MKKKDYLLLFGFSLIFFSVIASIQKVPGYMDAEYYYGQSIRIVEYRDLQENFIWNYLNDPVTIPTEGFSFWMPITSILASMGLWFFRSTNFFFARTPFIFLAALIPVLTAYFAYQFLPRKWAGWLAGGLAIFSYFYLPYITITDSFTPYMVFGGFFFSFSTK